MSRPNRWLRAATAISLIWAAGICGIALYERTTTDPWTFIGENRGPIFYSWSQHLVYDTSSFGEIVLVLDMLRFSVALIAPVVAVFALAAVVPALARHVCDVRMPL